MDGAHPTPDTDALAKAVAAERLTFFADAVIAIAITLLALELPVPHGATNHQLLESVSEGRNEYIAFLISFVVIGGHWSGHHRVFRYVETVGGRLGLLTMFWLLMQVVTPFATKVLSGDGGFQFRFIFYASVQALAGLLFVAMILTIRKHELHRPDTPPTMFANALVGTGAMAFSFLISIPISLFTHWSYVCWVLVPVFMRLSHRILSYRNRHHTA